MVKKVMSENDFRIIKWLLTTRPEMRSGNFESVVHWKQQYEKQLLAWSEPVDMAIAGGFLANCPAYAFATGYWAALYRLMPDLSKISVPALCISEKHGAHPGRIKCRLERSDANGHAGGRWRLNGKKHFVTCAREAELLIVAASTGTDADGKNRLRMALVDRATSGITVRPLEKPIAILPEISHGIVKFSDVEVSGSDILPEDGYLSYIKPFRTIEDLHVLASILGYLLRVASLFDWPNNVKEQMIALLLAIRTTSMADFRTAEIHIATGGVTESFNCLLSNIEEYWNLVDHETQNTWKRDRTVLNIAQTARQKRLVNAWLCFS